MIPNVFTMRKPLLLSLSTALVVAFIAVWGASVPRRSDSVTLLQPHLCQHEEAAGQSSPHGVFDNIKILFVLDPNCPLCFEDVGIDDYTNHTLLPWVRGLKDALTFTVENPEGLDLEVRLLNSSCNRKAAQASDRRRCPVQGRCALHR